MLLIKKMFTWLNIHVWSSADCEDKLVIFVYIECECHDNMLLYYMTMCDLSTVLKFSSYRPDLIEGCRGTTIPSRRCGVAASILYF